MKETATHSEEEREFAWRLTQSAVDEENVSIARSASDGVTI